MLIKSVKLKVSCFLCLFVLFFCSQLSAQIPNAELINFQTNLVVKNNKLYKTQTCEIRINNRQGEKYADISIPFSKMQKISKIEAFIKTIDGKIVNKLKSSDIKERSEFPDYSFYEDCFVKEFSLYHNEYPYILSYSFQQLEEEFFWISNWSPTINSDLPCEHAVLTLEIPRNYEIVFKGNLIENPKTDTTTTTINYSWKSAYSKVLSGEIFSPYLYEAIPSVKIVPLSFKYEVSGSFNDWKSYGNWEYRLMDKLNELTESEKKKINSLVQNVGSGIEKIKVLYHYLQDETRYINISVERGGMKPYPADYVCENKYGDCKAITNYFKAVLAYVGITSYITDVYAGSHIKKIDISFPSQQFNHVILCVPQQKDTLWLDCTSKGPFNCPGTFTQNRTVFVIDEHNSHLTHTPVMQNKDALETRVVKVNSSLNDDVQVSFHNTYKGEEFEILSSILKTANADSKSDIIRNHYIENGFELENYTLIPAHRDSDCIVLNYSARNDKLLKRYGNEILLKTIPFSIPTFKEPKYRKNDVEISYPICYADTIEYMVPAGCSFVDNLKPVEIKTNYGEYSMHCKLQGNLVMLYKNFSLNAGYYSLNQYNEFYIFVKLALNMENNSYLVFKKPE